MNESSNSQSYVWRLQMVMVGGALYLALALDWKSVGIAWICRLLLLHFIWVLWSWRAVAGTLLNPYTLFMLSATIFNAALGLLEALHLNRELLLEEFAPETVSRTMVLVLLALTSLHFGALLAVGRRPPKLNTSIESTPETDRALRLIGGALIVVSIVPVFLQVKDAVTIAITTGYLGLYQQQAAGAGFGSAILALADLFLPGTFFFLSARNNSRLERIIILAIFLSYCGTLLLVGYRGWSTLPVVTLAWLWDRTFGRLPRVALLAGAIVLLVGVFPLIRETRGLSAQERRGGGSALNTLSELDEHPAISAIAEMGGSVVTVAHTLELVPQYHAYEQGVGYLYAALTVVPSLFWDRHPTIARGIPSAWLIQEVDPSAAQLGAGLGYSFIAEAFLNFGILGVAAVSLLLGVFVVRLWLWAEHSDDPARFAVVACVLPYLLFYARAEAAVLPRTLVWNGLIPYWTCLYLRRLMMLRRRVETMAGDVI